MNTYADMRERDTKSAVFLKKRRSEDEEPIVWLSGHPKQQRFSFPATQEFKAFAGMYWPNTEAYHNPLGAVFSAQVLSSKLLSMNSMLLFRDGLVPLLWFFKVFPQPRTIKTTLIVPSPFARAVPSAWLRQVKFYTLVQVANPLKKPIALYIIGGTGSAHTDIPLIRNRVEACKNLLDGRIQDVEKRYFISSNPGDPDSPSRLFETFQILFSEFGFQGRPITWAEYNSSTQNPNCVSLSLNSDLAVYDDFAAHASASRGAFQVHLPVVSSISKVQIPLSPYHGMNIHDSMSAIEEAGEPILSRHEIMRTFGHEIYLKAPWPTFFSRWT